MSDWYLGNAEEQAAAYPRSFFIPSEETRRNLAVGELVRLLFFLTDPRDEDPRAERMWVGLERVEGHEYVGVLTNQPAAITGLDRGDEVRFRAEHVIDVSADDPYGPFLAFTSRRLLEDDSLEPGWVIHDRESEDHPPREDGTRASGWQLFVGDETQDETDDPANVRIPNLSWLMRRYPAFGALVRSGEQDGGFFLDGDRYVRDSGQ